MGFFSKFGSAIKKVTKNVRLSDFDPTYSKAKFGGLTRSIVSTVPGGGAALGGVEQAKQIVRLGKTVKDPAAGSIVAPANPAPPQPSGTPTAANALPSEGKDNTKMIVLGVGAAIVIVLLLNRK